VILAEDTVYLGKFLCSTSIAAGKHQDNTSGRLITLCSTLFPVLHQSSYAPHSSTYNEEYVVKQSLPSLKQ
jgi:hypothetical protein